MKKGTHTVVEVDMKRLDRINHCLGQIQHYADQIEEDMRMIGLKRGRKAHRETDE